MTMSAIVHPPPVAVRGDLDKVQCQCGKLDCEGRNGQLKQVCHPDAALTVFYQGARGILRVTCAQCDSLLVNIQVAMAVPS